jgi:hypothetical protein
LARPVERAEVLEDPPEVQIARAARRRRMLDRAVVDGLEDRGLEAVRILLVLGGAPGEPGNIPGLYDLRGNYISRADAELWVERETRTAKRRQSWCFYALLFLTSVAAIASVVAAVKAGVVHR